MEKNLTKEEFKQAQLEVAELSAKIATLEIEYNTLNDKYIRESLKREDFERRLEISEEIKNLKAERSIKQSKINNFISSDLSRMARLAAEAERKNPETYSKGEQEHSNNKSSGNGYKAALITILAVIAVGVTLIALNLIKGKGRSILPEPSPTATTNTNPKDEFSKLSKSEILERAQYIYDNELSSDLKAYTTVEELADLIATGLSELPIYETGNLRGSASDAMEDSIKVYGGGIAGKELPIVNYSSRTLDNSDLDFFATKYDEVYNNIAIGRNTNNPELAISNIDKLGTMLYYDFIFTNFYSNNIDNIPAELKAFALSAAIERWPIYVDSYLASNDLTRCVSVCINQDTKELGSYNVQDIFQAVLNGRSDNHKVSLSSTSEGNVEGGLMAGYFDDLVAELEYKDEHGFCLK